MSWSNTKEEKYRIELVGNMPTDKTQTNKTFDNPYDNPELWAKSTLPPGYNSETLVKVYELSDAKIKGQNRRRTWLHDVLDDRGILYKIEVVGYWATRRRFAEKQLISVEEKYKKKVQRLIKEFNDAEDIMQEETDEENMLDNIDDGLPQVKCPSCGKEIDFDYVKCPFCKTKL